MRNTYVHPFFLFWEAFLEGFWDGFGEVLGGFGEGLERFLGGLGEVFWNKKVY